MVRIAGSFYEFFAGAGMVRAGLGNQWSCLFANDFDRKKASTYTLNWGADHLLCDDVRNVATDDLTGIANLVWASFPCQDLSLAGSGAGLKGERLRYFLAVLAPFDSACQRIPRACSDCLGKCLRNPIFPWR